MKIADLATLINLKVVLNTSTKWSFFILGGITLLVVFYQQYNTCDCEERVSYANVYLNNDINLDSLYRPIDTLELNAIRLGWQNYDLSSDSFNITNQAGYYHNRKLLIIEHFAKGARHFGALVFPVGFDPQKRYPLLVWANGLNQKSPAVSLQDFAVKKVVTQLTDHFIVIPSYRGQALVLGQRRFCSDGFFGDAFDGAADDALRLLELIKNEVTGVDDDKITVFGISRGATVALLMGARDRSIKNIIAAAAPTNFYTPEVYHRYGRQYRYQFLSTTSEIERIRAKIIKSSPLYFIEDYSNAMLLIHGEKDSVVPVSEALAIVGKLEGRDDFVSIITKGGHEFQEWDRAFKWIIDHS